MSDTGSSSNATETESNSVSQQLPSGSLSRSLWERIAATAMKLGGLGTAMALIPWGLKRYNEFDDWKPIAGVGFSILVIATGTKVVDVVKAVNPFAKK